MCGVPSTSIYQSRQVENGRGFGQQRKTGHVGVGESFELGIGAIPAFGVSVGRGFEIGSLPLLDQASSSGSCDDLVCTDRWRSH